MSIYTLTYRKERSQEICVETIENIGKDVNLYFNREYDEAIKLVKEIILLQGIKEDEEDRGTNVDRSYKQNNKRDVAKYGCNNRILFAGQRGCGKTSVMRSLAEYLSKHKITINYDGDKDDIKVRCCCLPMVDPSHFDNNNNILLTVITSMFSVAKGYMKEFGDKNDTADREDLLRQFEKVFKSLDSIKSEITSYTLESLNRKSDAEDLRKKMNNLVAKYLKYIVGDKESRLVLLIDDIDMSVSYAPEMLEQLRKYLELDNLIILMSANLGQLSNEMREKYSSAFQYTLKDSNQALSIDVEDLATKYLLKLFPTSRRVNVERHASQLLKTKLKIMGDSQNDSKEDEPIVEEDFQKVILSLIWSKTRLLFIPKDPENTLHPIIPTNLRDLAQFLDMLTALDKVEPGENKLFKNSEEYDKCNKNLQVFKHYVMNTWIPNHLTVEEELVFHNIPTDITEINKHLINSINVIGTKHKTRLMSREVSLDMIERNAENVNIDRDIYTMVSPNDPKFVKANKISDIFNQPSNYSYGDLLLMIDKYETYFESEEDRRFTDAIKIYYSILLFETMFFKSQNVDYTFEDNKKYEVIPIQKLIGGNVYYPNYFEIITDKNFNQKGPSFDAKRAFYHKVKVTNDNKVGDKYPLFAVLYYGDIRPDRYEKNHIYDTTFKKNAEVDGVNYVTFDILSILNNMLNPCHTLSRLDDGGFKPKNWGTVVGDIKRWGKYNNIIDDSFIPNAILPFYAVDLMLTYLRYDCSTEDLLKMGKGRVQTPNTTSARHTVDFINIFFESSSSRMIIILHLLKFILSYKEVVAVLKDIAQKNTLLEENKESLLAFFSRKSLTGEDFDGIKEITEGHGQWSEEENNILLAIVSKEVVSKEDMNQIKGIIQNGQLLQNDKDTLNKIASKILITNAEENNFMRILSKGEKRKLEAILQDVYNTVAEVDIENTRILIENLEIIIEVHSCFDKFSLGKQCHLLDNKDSLADLYRNHVIALILGKSLTTKKEKEGLIKDLHKYNSVSEIYKQLVENLWKNAIMEICIRGKIQEVIRDKVTVGCYYKELYNKETVKILNYITVGEIKPMDIYKRLCEEAGKIFINNDFQLNDNA